MQVITRYVCRSQRQCREGWVPTEAEGQRELSGVEAGWQDCAEWAARKGAIFQQWEDVMFSMHLVEARWRQRRGPEEGGQDQIFQQPQ